MTPEERYSVFRHELLDVADGDVLRRPLREWVSPAEGDDLAPSLYDRPLRAVLEIKFRWHVARRGVDAAQIVRFLDRLGGVLKEVSSDGEGLQDAGSGDWQAVGTARYERLRDEVAENLPPENLTATLRDWAGTGDTHLPKALVDRPLREVLVSDFHVLVAPSEIGRRRAEKFLDLLSRAAAGPPEMPPGRSADERDDADDPSEEYRRLRSRLLSVRDRSVLDRPLRSWPRFYRAGLSLCFTDPPIVELLAEDYEDHALKNGGGPLRLERFLEVLGELWVEVADQDVSDDADGKTREDGGAREEGLAEAVSASDGEVPETGVTGVIFEALDDAEPARSPTGTDEHGPPAVQYERLRRVILDGAAGEVLDRRLCGWPEFADRGLSPSLSAPTLRSVLGEGYESHLSRRLVTTGDLSD